MESHEAISTIRRKAELARRLARETDDPEAKAALLNIASQLDADANKFEQAIRRFAEKGT